MIPRVALSNVIKCRQAHWFPSNATTLIQARARAANTGSMAVLSSGIGLAGLLLIFSGFLFTKAASFDTSRGDKFKALAKLTLLALARQGDYTTALFKLRHYPAAKIIENHMGKAFVKVQQQIIIGPGPAFLYPSLMNGGLAPAPRDVVVSNVLPSTSE